MPGPAGKPLGGPGIANLVARTHAGEDVVVDTRSEGFTRVSVPDGYAEYLLGQLFEPWAAVLTARARIRPGQRVLDVASGLGPVARLAAEAAGPGGRVTASDISGAMLAAAAARPAPSGWVPVEYLECPAAAIAA